MPVSQLLWGPTYENQLVLADPLYDLVSDREIRDGSEVIQGSSGVEDAWITGRDFTLAGEARFLPDASASASGVSGPLSWQAFLDWARDKNPFRFVPDQTNPLFYVDGCYLVDPLKGFGSLGADIKRRVPFKFRNPTVDFHQALRGVMFEYYPGASLTDPLLATFARAGARTYRGAPGNLAAAIGASAAAAVLRDRSYEGTLRTTLTERARTQLVTDPENFGAWSLVNTPIRTSGQADPFGGTAAYLVEDDDAASGEGLSHAITFTGDGTKALAVFVRRNNYNAPEIGLWDVTAATWRHRIVVNFDASGAVTSVATTTGSGTIYAAENWGAGWWRILFSPNGIVAANSNAMYFYPAGIGAAPVGKTYIFGANAWDAVFPSSYQGPSIGSALADAFSYPFGYAWQAVAMYSKWVERGAVLEASASGILHLGPTGIGSRVFELNAQGNGTTYRVTHGNSGTGFVEASNMLSPVIGDVMEALCLLFPDGSVKIRLAKNGSAEQEVVNAATLALPAGSPGTVYIGRRDAALEAAAAHAAHKVMPLTFAGVQMATIAQARAA